MSYRYIVRSEDVRGGNPRVEGTRIAVHDVIGLLQNGETVDRIEEQKDFCGNLRASWRTSLFCCGWFVRGHGRVG